MKYVSILVMLILCISIIQLFNEPKAFAQREINFEKTVNVKEKYLLATMSDVEKYYRIIPDNINSVSLVDGTKDQALMNVGLEGINFDVKTKYTTLSNGNHLIEVLEGDLKGTKLTTILQKTWGFDGTKNGGTIVKMKLDLEISGVLSLVAAIASDDAILFALDSSLLKFVKHAKVEQDYVEIVIPSLQDWKDYDKISFWFKNFEPKNTVKFYLRGDRLQLSSPYILETDSQEWKKFEIPLNSFSKINLKQVRGVSFIFDTPGQNSFVVDDIVLSGKNKEEKISNDNLTSLFNLHRNNPINGIIIQDSQDFKIGKISTEIQTTIIEGQTELRYDFAFTGKKGTIKELKPVISEEKLGVDTMTIIYIIIILAIAVLVIFYWKRKRTVSI